MKKWICFILFLLLLFFLPQLASLGVFKPFFLKAWSEKTEGDLDAKSLRLSWLGPQEFHQVKWKKSSLQIEGETFEIDAPIWSFSGPFTLKNGKILLDQLVIDELQMHYDQKRLQIEGKSLFAEGTIASHDQYQIQFSINGVPLSGKWIDYLGP